MQTLEKKKYLLFNEIFPPVPIALLVGAMNYYTVTYGNGVHWSVGLASSVFIWVFITYGVSHLIWKNVRKWHKEHEEERNALVMAYDDLQKLHRDLSADYLILLMSIHREPPFKDIPTASVRAIWRDGLRVLAQQVANAERVRERFEALGGEVDSKPIYILKVLGKAHERFNSARDFLKFVVCIPEVQKIQTWEDAMEL